MLLDLAIELVCVATVLLFLFDGLLRNKHVFTEVLHIEVNLTRDYWTFKTWM